MVVILANGEFPHSANALRYFSVASKLICCDGAVAKALQHGLNPDAIVGDFDSIPSELLALFKDRLHFAPDQNINDLKKSFDYCASQGWKNIVILGATGLREDHTIGNISRLIEFSRVVPQVKIVTDTGEFRVATVSGMTINTEAKKQISIFSFNPFQKITSHGLKYPLDQLQLRYWYEATLNESIGDSFTLEFEPDDPLLIFLCDK